MSVIKRLLVTDPVKRLTAEQVLTEVERIIIMWRNIAPGDKQGTLQVSSASSVSHRSNVFINRLFQSGLRTPSQIRKLQIRRREI